MFTIHYQFSISHLLIDVHLYKFFTCLNINELRLNHSSYVNLSPLSVANDGAWGLWDIWSSCASVPGATCTGIRHRTRECNLPYPRNDGAACPGDDNQYEQCATACDEFGRLLCI